MNQNNKRKEKYKVNKRNKYNQYENVDTFTKLYKLGAVKKCDIILLICSSEHLDRLSDFLLTALGGHVQRIPQTAIFVPVWLLPITRIDGVLFRRHFHKCLI